MAELSEPLLGAAKKGLGCCAGACRCAHAMFETIKVSLLLCAPRPPAPPLVCTCVPPCASLACRCWRRKHSDTQLTTLGRRAAPHASGFRDFILRGDVVSLAVAVVVGNSFTALVSTTIHALPAAAAARASASRMARLPRAWDP